MKIETIFFKDASVMRLPNRRVIVIKKPNRLIQVRLVSLVKVTSKKQLHELKKQFDHVSQIRLKHVVCTKIFGLSPEGANALGMALLLDDSHSFKKGKEARFTLAASEINQNLNDNKGI